MNKKEVLLIGITTGTLPWIIIFMITYAITPFSYSEALVFFKGIILPLTGFGLVLGTLLSLAFSYLYQKNKNIAIILLIIFLILYLFVILGFISILLLGISMRGFGHG